MTGAFRACMKNAATCQTIKMTIRATKVPLTVNITLDHVAIHVVHDIAELRLPRGARVVVSGHSHKPKIEEREGVSRRTSVHSRTTTTRGETNVRSREGTEKRSREGTTVRSGGSSDARRGEVRTKSGSETGRSGGESSRSSGQSKGGASKGGETGQSPSNQQPTK